jgi:hypothetical protein
MCEFNCKVDLPINFQIAATVHVEILNEYKAEFYLKYPLTLNCFNEKWSIRQKI